MLQFIFLAVQVLVQGWGWSKSSIPTTAALLVSLLRLSRLKVWVSALGFWVSWPDISFQGRDVNREHQRRNHNGHDVNN